MTLSALAIGMSAYPKVGWRFMGYGSYHNIFRLGKQIQDLGFDAE